MSHTVNFIVLFLSSYLISITLFSIVIKVSLLKNIFDNPNEVRKFHKTPIPNIGGVALLFTILLNMLFYPFEKYNLDGINYFAGAIIFLFLFSLKDDLVGLSSSKRLLAQLIAGAFLIIFGNFRLHDLSFIGLSNINYIQSVIISLFFFIFITNSYNLIDGLNGLLGCFTLLSSICFAVSFNVQENVFLFALNISLIGTILGFLFYNFGHAKIFMGSSGSYIIGAIMYFNSVQYLNSFQLTISNSPKFAYLFGFLAIPLFDTIRVFFLRIFQRQSPFIGDSNHIHHRLLLLNLSHSNIVFVLLSVNLGLILLNIVLQNFSNIFVILFDLLFLIITNIILESYLRKKTDF
jgi:UDP-N-acetylmuramyl pentapeptide phosphotransferase/UDP-N-acetylglucosamine-1-phosphate transferase